MLNILKILVFFIIITTNLKADILEEPLQITTSTAFLPDININYNPDIEVITSKEIEQLGYENLADILSTIGGINIYRINSSSAAIDIRGYAEIADCTPTILIDGREVYDGFVLRSYFNILPLTIDDIDRIEILKGNTFYSDGYSSPAGLINIVTKSSEELTANYINVSKGSNDFKKVNFSINRYLLDTYFKITGEIKAIDEYNSSKEANKNKFIELSVDKYLGEKSLLNIKISAANRKLTLNDRFLYKFFNHWKYLPYDNFAPEVMDRNLFISYKYPTLEVSFLYNYYHAQAYAKVIGIDTSFMSGSPKSKYYKFNIKKDFYFAKHKLTTGLVNRYQDFKFFSNRPSINIFTIYLKDEFNLSKYLTLRGLIKNDRATNYGNNFNYYVGLMLHSKDKSYGIELEYSKNIKFPRGEFKYFKHDVDLSNILKGLSLSPFINTNGIIKNNKNLRPIKFYSSDLKLFYSKKDFKFKTTLFYNRITDVVAYTIDLNNYSLVFFPKNFSGYTIHGFETDLQYNISKYLKLFSSYYLQHIKVKTLNKQKDFIVPQYKFTAGTYYSLPFVSGSIIYYYVPSVKQIDNKASDDYSQLDISINKNFLNKKLKFSFVVKNLLNNIHRETPYGFKIKRSFFVKIGYNF